MRLYLYCQWYRCIHRRHMSRRQRSRSSTSSAPSMASCTHIVFSWLRIFMHQLIFQCLLQMFYESDSSSEFVFTELKSSYSFSRLASFSRISIASYLKYSSKGSVQTDNSEYIQKNSEYLQAQAGDSECHLQESRFFKNWFFFWKSSFLQTHSTAELFQLGSDTTKCNTPNLA